MVEHPQSKSTKPCARPPGSRYTFIEIPTDLPEDVDSGGGRRRRVTAEYPSAAAIDAAEQTGMNEVVVKKDSPA